MSREDESDGMYRPDPETAQRVGWILAALLFGLAIVSFIGEIRGWWGLFGQIGMTVGTIGGLFVAFAAYLRGAESEEVLSVHAAVTDTNEAVERTHVAVERTHEAVEDTYGAVERTHGAVQDNGETLSSIDGKLDKLDELDVIQAELDEQTGALQHQIRVLEQIRDRA